MINIHTVQFQIDGKQIGEFHFTDFDIAKTFVKDIRSLNSRVTAKMKEDRVIETHEELSINFLAGALDAMQKVMGR